MAMMKLDRKMALLDLCHLYGASRAPRVLSVLAQEAEDDLLWFLENSEIPSPGDFLVTKAVSRGDLVLQYTLDNIEEQEAHGHRARRLVVNWFLFCGILEIGLQADVFPLELPDTFSEVLLKELEVAPQGFWNDLGLPLLSELQRRLSGYPVREVESGPELLSLFSRFLILNSSLRSDLDMTYLFEVTKLEGNDDERALKDALQSPQTLANRLPEFSIRNKTDRLLVGICSTFNHLRELFALIEDAGENYPYLADSIRSYNRYWTDLLLPTTGLETASIVLNSFQKWADEADDEEAHRDIEEIRRFISQPQLKHENANTQVPTSPVSV